MGTSLLFKKVRALRALFMRYFFVSRIFGIKKFLRFELHSEKLAFKLQKNILMIELYNKPNSSYLKKATSKVVVSFIKVNQNQFFKKRMLQNVFFFTVL